MKLFDKTSQSTSKNYINQPLRKWIGSVSLSSAFIISGSALAYEQSLSCSAFSSISGNASSTVLSTVSNADDTTEVVALPFTFNWYGDTPVNNITVSSNGEINLNGSTSSNCCSADPVEIGGSITYPRIALAQEDLDPGNTTASNIYALDTGTSFIIEYNIVPFFPNNGEVNTQVELYPNGELEIRWGTGDTVGNTIAAGVEDDTRLVPAATPVTGAPFASNGTTSTFPTNQCRRFTPQTSTTTAVPIFTPLGIAMTIGGLLWFGRRRKAIKVTQS